MWKETDEKPMKTSDAGFSGGTNGSLDGASRSDLERGFMNTIEADEARNGPMGGIDYDDEGYVNRYEYRRRGGFLTRPIDGDER